MNDFIEKYKDFNGKYIYELIYNEKSIIINKFVVVQKSINEDDISLLIVSDNIDHKYTHCRIIHKGNFDRYYTSMKEICEAIINIETTNLVKENGKEH
jgi:hypothetical protein